MNIIKNTFDHIIDCITNDLDAKKETFNLNLFRYQKTIIVYSKKYVSSWHETIIRFSFPNNDTIVAKVIIKNRPWRSIIWDNIATSYTKKDIAIEFISHRPELPEHEDIELSMIKEAFIAFLDVEAIISLHESCIAHENKEIMQRNFNKLISN